MTSSLDRRTFFVAVAGLCTGACADSRASADTSEIPAASAASGAEANTERVVSGPPTSEVAAPPPPSGRASSAPPEPVSAEAEVALEAGVGPAGGKLVLTEGPATLEIPRDAFAELRTVSFRVAEALPKSRGPRAKGATYRIQIGGPAGASTPAPAGTKLRVTLPSPGVKDARVLVTKITHQSEGGTASSPLSITPERVGDLVTFTIDAADDVQLHVETASDQPNAVNKRWA